MDSKVAVILGASGGIGQAITHYLTSDSRFANVVGTYRTNPPSNLDPQCQILLDIEDEESIAAAAQKLRESHQKVHLLVNTIGMLHTEEFGPEKKLQDLEPENLARIFRVNAIGPALVFKHFHPFFRHDEPSIFATLSARVGSIGDNFIGGWYGYRASKAALNQFMRTASIEMARKAPQCAMVSVHPGTVATALSEPFQKNVPDHKLFSPEYSAQKILEVLNQLDASQTGKFFAWDGQEIPW
ncbi:SDR family NAD(P)-dependent oxidoreductase [Microvenator marinus]|uniref:SDR family NAD(P)-dependent oxidoreductase n=1 Tax=Microvenator marinus TaxID=2600177 RepID=A0A5B8XY07_9DELT|nr:SDR family NAD(P)-dependent oxidoreductase [Microvenator marinus]QED28923.1 SDR family NAD(P)-dependent oxidoreductase [Microvenator marinus]